MTPGAPVYFGVAGWSYPDWAGIMYPRGARPSLAAVARYVDVMEINSTFYRPPLARHAEDWLAQTAFQPGFRFSAKLHRDVTHGGLLEPDLVRAVRDGLAPLVRAGALSHLLAQFPYDFDDAPVHRDRLAHIRESFAGLGVLTLELRHAAWRAPSAQAFLAGLEVSVATLDYPESRTGFGRAECRLGRDRYLRLHGRNAQAWFRAGAGRDETYNYTYSAAELEEIRGRAESLRRDARSLTVVANNHFQAKEVTTILRLKALLTGRPVPVPPGLMARYPDLKAIAAEEPVW